MKEKTGKLCLFARQPLNYAIYKDANVLNINVLVNGAQERFAKEKRAQNP